MFEDGQSKPAGGGPLPLSTGQVSTTPWFSHMYVTSDITEPGLCEFLPPGHRLQQSPSSCTGSTHDTGGHRVLCWQIVAPPLSGQ